MTRPALIVTRAAAALLLACGGLAGCAHAPASPPAMDLADAERFAALLQAHGLPSAAQLQSGYLDPGSDGIRIFTPHRIVNATRLAERVARRRPDYERAVALCLPVARRLQAEASRLIDAVGDLLQQPQRATAYVVFGAGNSGGTADAQGLVLGLEVLCQQAANEAEAEQVLKDFVVHEMTHVHQARAGAHDGPDSLLRQVLVEGFADHVMARVLGPAARADALRHQHGLANEAALWREFKGDVDAGKTDTDWLYRQHPRQPGRPADMGYWIGKRICEAYLQQASDKQGALRTLLQLKDPQAILAASGYARRFEGPGR